jgi:hypothetical protein
VKGGGDLQPLVQALAMVSVVFEIEVRASRRGASLDSDSG